MGVVFLLLPVVFCAAAASVFQGSNEIEGAMVNSNSRNTYNCGLQKSSRIMGGSETRPGEFPWVAALEYEHTSNHENAGIRCGGSVVSPRYVLTAAHCIHPSGMEIIKVWVGVWKISEADTTDADKVQKLDIEKQIRHENFNNPRRHNDIGLLRLAEDIIFTDYVRAICLPKQDLAPPPLETMMTVAGWGKTGDGTPSDIKLKVELPLVSNDVCIEDLQFPIGDNHICAGGEGMKDCCKGDSGGPLMTSFTDTASGNVYWYQPGIVSFGRRCGTGNSPSVYTRVSKYINWIASNVE